MSEEEAKVPPEEEIYVPEEPPVEEERRERRGRRRKYEVKVDPEPLKKLTGDEVVQLFDYLHMRYLSWINEAEASKYFNVTQRAFEEALRRQETVLSQLSEQFGKVLGEKVGEALEAIERRIQQIEQRMEKLETKPVTVDERLLALGLAVADALIPKDHPARGILALVARGLMRGQEEQPEQ